MAFYVADWLAATSLCSPATRGIWLDLIGVMHQNDRAGSITGTVSQLARAGRCSTVEMEAAINEIVSQKIADVTRRDNVVTLTCRRMKKAENERKRAKLGMAKTRALRRGCKVIPISEPNTVTGVGTPVTPPADKTSAVKIPKIYFGYESDGKIHGINAPLLKYWKEQFPAIDVEQEIRNASVWLDSNRKRRKKDVKRFLTNWLLRKQESARPERPAASPAQQVPISAPVSKFKTEKLN